MRIILITSIRGPMYTATIIVTIMQLLSKTLLLEIKIKENFFTNERKKLLTEKVRKVR
jgi:hypothetical protein